MFLEKQWGFYVPCFEYDWDAVLDRRCVLPVVERVVLAEGEGCVRFKVVMDGEFNKLTPPCDADSEQGKFDHEEVAVIRDESGRGEDRPVNIFVLKTYRNKRAKEFYRAECDRFRSLMRNDRYPKNVVRFLGNFEHLDTYNLLLEYACQGSLESLMMNKQNSPPWVAEDVTRFWKCVLEVADGLQAIHATNCGHADASLLGLW